MEERCTRLHVRIIHSRRPVMAAPLQALVLRYKRTASAHVRLAPRPSSAATYSLGALVLLGCSVTWRMAHPRHSPSPDTTRRGRAS